MSWICFLLLANKKYFLDFSPTCYLGMIIGFLTDILTDSYPLWEYDAGSDMQEFLIETLDEFGVYFVTIYLFLQTLPKMQTVWTMTRHIFLWSLYSIALEWVAIKTGYMKHGLWWSLGCSYLSDWLLFISFYLHHKMRDKYLANRSC
ncbi:CBO0543 family protein [Effusibacillus consociatus]|uniref:CBO0543 family protein n=1 Tax=Effusibacillus consociatus TaxID=1117041 RepID=A0ABV9PWH3_9BACL